jgi:hypothetical protein
MAAVMKSEVNAPRAALRRGRYLSGRPDAGRLAGGVHSFGGTNSAGVTGATFRYFESSALRPQ